MGQAEQRQVQTGVAARLRREQAVADAHSARLEEIRRWRRDLDEHDRRRPGLERGMRASAGLAILDDDPPSDEAVAQACGWTVADVEALRRDLLRRYPEPEPRS